jgi:HD-GYP domain-containing protein (c-di-GMP phosphodiesterase class II)
MPVSKAYEIMEKELGTAIDPACFRALQSALERAESEAA